jgi:N-acetylneuraminic acid mutarotase
MYAFRGKSADDCDVNGVYSLTVSCLDLTADYASNDFKWTHVRCVTSSEGEVLPRARSAHTATVIDDRIFIFGGVDAKTGDDLDELWEFVPATSVWKKLANGTRARSAHASTSVDERYLLVCGGSTGNELCDCGAVDVYDIVTGVWQTVKHDDEDSNRPSPRAAHACVSTGNRWFIIGGGDNENAIDDAYALDLRACVDEQKCRWTLFVDSCNLIGKEGMSANAVASPTSGCVYLLLHGGQNEKGAVCDTIACKLKY